MVYLNPSTILIPLLLLLITPIFFLFGLGITRRSQRSLPSDEHCESLLWKDILDTETLRNGKGLHQRKEPTEHGKRCWDEILDQAFNQVWKKSRRRAQNARKPNQLGNSDHHYLRIDLTVLHALVLICATDEGSKREPDEQGYFSYGGVSIEDIRMLDEDDETVEEDLGVATAHIRAAQPQRPLAKLEVDRLLEGFPPWFYKDTFTVNVHGQQYILPTPIRHIVDLSRGGWIIALGLTSDEPLPLYYDFPWEMYDPKYDRDNFRTRRAGHFWQAILCVQDIIRHNFAEAFPEEPVVVKSLERINAMIAAESDDPGHVEQESFLANPISMKREQCEFAIDVFNSPADALAIRRFLGKVLVPVLSAAVDGVEKAFKYMKDPGRELNMGVPAALRNASAIFLRDCEY